MSDYKATVETEDATFTFEGDDPMVVMAQAASMPVQMHSAQIQDHVELDTPVWRYLKAKHEQQKEQAESHRPPRNRRD